MSGNNNKHDNTNDNHNPHTSPSSPFNDENRFHEINLSTQTLETEEESVNFSPRDNEWIQNNNNSNNIKNGISNPKTRNTGSILRNSISKRKNSNAKIVFSDHDETINAYGNNSSSLDNTTSELMKISSNDSFTHTPNIHQSSTFDDPQENVPQLKPKNNSIMKKHRWGTQRRKDGAPVIGRARTLRWRNRHEKPIQNDEDSSDSEESDPSKNRANEFRQIYFNIPLPQEFKDEHGEPSTIYPRNKIRTTKYTALSFIPKNLLFQFSNVANIYFLIMDVLGYISIFGVPSPSVNIVPLIVIVIITAIKDAIEDSRRTILDIEVNNTPTHILHGVINHNVNEDNISLWRKFKKSNSKALMKFLKWCSYKFTKKGREKERLEKLTRDNIKNLRNSFDSFEANRKSFQLDDLSNPFGDAHETIDANDSIIDPSVPRSNNNSIKFQKDFWKNVKVGDIVRIQNNDEIPADIVLLSTSDVDKACYVETKGLDGETNLKVRQALKAGHLIKHTSDIERSKFWVESEGPHANLYSYQGNLKWYGEDSQIKNEPININNLLLRGCSLRNTKWAIGVVVFTGSDTKIMMNSGETPTKKSKMSRDLNYTVALNFSILFIICFVSGLVSGISYNEKSNSRNQFEYGTIAGSPVGNGIVNFFVGLILYQSLVPISLYISIEIIKTAQAFFIYSDVNMYYAKLDYPCTPKSWNISDDLGQIEYIFSDKTGTLTQNVMEFKKCTINGISYGRAYTEALAGLRKRQGVDVESESAREKQLIAQDKEVMIEELNKISQNKYLRPDELTFISREFVEDLNMHRGPEQKQANENFMLALGLCHSVLVETDKDEPEKLLLKSQSPDEAALVGTARDVGFSFIKRTKKGVILDIQGVTKEYQILNVLEFNSTRKRMSAIIKIPGATENDEPTALLICKGADSIIYSRLSKDSDQQLMERTALHLEEYATEGLRTLCIAQRELSWSEYSEWNKRHDIAAAALVKREEKMEEVADSIERELTLLGGTAIEDRLQDGVPDSIALLSKAGIKLWVLTGDKVETAINIGFSCNLLGNDMELLVLKTSGDDVETIADNPFEIVSTLLDRYLNEKFDLDGTWEEIEEAKLNHNPPEGNFGVVIDGDALKLALVGDNMRKFLLLCKQCKAVLCCRVSPAQKAAVVKMVKENLEVMTLAIGDGANDVAMIQSADIGVGIAGEEGRQAIMSSDYAIGQFRFLTRLILIHGRWSYRRVAEMIPTFFYKNVIFTLALFWYGIYNQFDGTYLFEYTYLMFYTLAYTSLPVIFMGIFDQDVNSTVSLLVPQLYTVGILGSEWTMGKFWRYMVDGIYQSLMSFFIPYCLYYKTGFVSHNGLNLDHRYWMGTIVATIAAISCNIFIMMHLNNWDWFSLLFIALSILIIFAWTGIWSSTLTSQEYYKSAAQLYGNASFWACLFIGIICCLLPRFVCDVYAKVYQPKDSDIIRELVLKGEFDQYPENYDPTDPNRVKITKLTSSFDDVEASGANTDFTESPIRTPSKSFFRKSSQGASFNYPINDEEVDTEEISMSMTHVNGTTRLRSDTHNIDNTDNLENYNPRTSLDKTRLSMMRDRQLGDGRVSIENARASLDLPGITRAETLMSSSSRQEI
ncbi:hypothetical protein WICMUC_001582 [Wickerhamomyces mucosus]|uniref:Phospholipid-transporting ATPase n=1 Tax=Wickerhamomyces mucosus TaxID=1378264 RepID=A0A9P8TGW6_9ASCO|nr:hypothetical protein WICMUC_001582 [Wickerhamomyces mucosus]